jgi:hypothetical protein
MCLEEFEVGQVVHYAMSRTVTEPTSPVHLPHHEPAAPPPRRGVRQGIGIRGAAREQPVHAGPRRRLSVHELTLAARWQPGLRLRRVPPPRRHGDTIEVEAEVMLCGPRSPGPARVWWSWTPRAEPGRRGGRRRLTVGAYGRPSVRSFLSSLTGGGGTRLCLCASPLVVCLPCWRPLDGFDDDERPRDLVPGELSSRGDLQGCLSRLGVPQAGLRLHHSGDLLAQHVEGSRTPRRRESPDAP